MNFPYYSNAIYLIIITIIIIIIINHYQQTPWGCKLSVLVTSLNGWPGYHITDIW